MNRSNQSGDGSGQPGYREQMGRWMIVGAWLLLLALLTLIFSQWMARQNNPNQHLRAEADVRGGTSVTLIRNRAGHYVAPGDINGVGVDFLLDTGATFVAVPESVAQKAGLVKGPVTESMTANGIAQSWLTEIDEVRLGPIVQRHVRATILPGMAGDEVLLGMNFLRHLKLEQRGDSLKISVP